METRSMLMRTIGLAAIAAAHAESAANDNYVPKSFRDHSKPATLTPKTWKKRKRKLQIAKASRKANRK